MSLKHLAISITVLVSCSILGCGQSPKPAQTTTLNARQETKSNLAHYEIPGPTLMHEETLIEQMNIAIGFAQQMLRDSGEFFPFGNVARMDGTVDVVAADPGEGENPDPNKVLRFLEKVFREGAIRGDIRSCMVCADVRLRNSDGTSPTDAIALRFALRDGEPFDIALPYEKGKSGQYEYGELIRMRGTLDVKWK